MDPERSRLLDDAMADENDEWFASQNKTRLQVN